MTYDAMRAMAKRNEHGSLICYARLTTITNHTSISRNQNQMNIVRLDQLGWLIQEERSRWRGGRFGSNRYEVLEHADYDRLALRREEPYILCPVFKFEASTGERLQPSSGVPENFAAEEYLMNTSPGPTTWTWTRSNYLDMAPGPSIVPTRSK